MIRSSQGGFELRRFRRGQQTCSAIRDVESLRVTEPFGLEGAVDGNEDGAGEIEVCGGDGHGVAPFTGLRKSRLRTTTRLAERSTTSMTAAVQDSLVEVAVMVMRWPTSWAGSCAALPLKTAPQELSGRK